MKENKSLFQVVCEIKKEIYGYFHVLDKDKQEALRNNIKLHSPATVLSDDWIHLTPIIDQLCSLPHVKIVSSSTFPVYEQIDFKGSVDIQESVHNTNIHMTASFSGFVDEVEKHSFQNGIPCYYFIYYVSNDGSKLIHYTTYLTINKLIDNPNETKKGL